MNDESVELKVARLVTGTLILAGLFTTMVGVVTLLRWAF